MSGTRALLLEIGVEELPAGMQRPLVASLGLDIAKALHEAELVESGADIKNFSTPRRLAVYLPKVVERQPDQVVEHRGPPVSVAFDDAGSPTKAATGFAGRFGVEAAALERRPTENGEYLFFTQRQEGREARTVLSEIVPRVVTELSVPKRMRWSDLDWGFARPVHWILALFGKEVVPFEVAGIRTDRFTRGHRYQAPEPVHLHLADDGEYRGLLRENFVGADATERHRRIKKNVCDQAEGAGGRIPDSAAVAELLDEVTGLVEWPVAFTGRFDPEFLGLPKEVLMTSMEKHQKFFPVEDGEGNLLSAFVGVANIESKDPDALRGGHERVLRARLADARFFWDADRKRSLADRVDNLRHVVFQAKLGTLFDKAQRLAQLAPAIAEQIEPTMATPAERAGWLAKADLLTEMVGEFDDLQGIMGHYYAGHDGEANEVAQALEEQYWPRHAGDSLPHSTTGRALALADRIDTIVGCFGIGLEPTGTKDPFGLRRAAIGILRICIEARIHLDLAEFLRHAYAAYGGRLEQGESSVTEGVIDFLLDRLAPMYGPGGGNIRLEVGELARESARICGIEPGEVSSPGHKNEAEAVLGLRPTDPYDAHLRLSGLLALLAHPNAEALIAANKRIGNILRKSGETSPEDFDPQLFVEAEERALAEAFYGVHDRFQEALGAREYTRALLSLADLRQPIDRFFDAVLVMVSDPILRRNRLGLLRTIQRVFLEVADLSKLPG